MAEEQTQTQSVEVEDRGILDFMGKKGEEHKKQHACAGESHQQGEGEEALASAMADVHVDGEKKSHHSLVEKLHRSHSSSSSSSSDEEDETGGTEKKKKKKGLKEKIKEKLSGEEKKPDDVAVKCEETTIITEVVVEEEKKDQHQHQHQHEVKEEVVAVKYEEKVDEKKGFLDKIKEKLPGGHCKPAGDAATVECDAQSHEGDNGQAKKGLLEKIKEKFPGYHKESESH